MNLGIIIIINLFFFLLFYKILSKKWLPNKKTVIAVIVGLAIFPLILLIQKSISGISGISEQQYILINAFLEETIKLIAVILFITFNRFKKASFLEVLGIGLGFAFVENVIYSHSQIFNFTLYNALLVSFIRLAGGLLLHTSTVGILSLCLIYLKSKKAIIVSTLLLITTYIHYLFNKHILNENDWALFGIWVFSLLVFSYYIFVNNKTENLETKDKLTPKIAKFILKYVGLFVVYFILLVSFMFLADNFNLQRYSPQEIESIESTQNELKKVATTWEDENLQGNYAESAKDLERIREIFHELDVSYSRIISLMKENKADLSFEDHEFLYSQESPIYKELNELTSKFNQE